MSQSKWKEIPMIGPDRHNNAILQSVMSGSRTMSPLITLDLYKEAQKTLSIASLERQVEYLKERVLGAGRERRGYTVAISPPRQRGYGPYKYEISLRIDFNPPTETTRLPTESDITKLIQIINKPAKQRGWNIDKIDGKDLDKDDLDLFADPEVPTEYYDFQIPDNWQTNFSHLYGLDAHISIIHKVVNSALNSDWLNRFHICLYGDPGCGKSDLALSVRNMVGKDACLEFDATSTTQAGALSELRDREEMPRILLVEEIEKADEGALRWLLSLMDIRGSVRKLTARSKFTIDTKLLCIATVNDISLFRMMLKGALSSRFAHQLYCKRPNEEILRKILTREIHKIDGNLDWIDPTIAYCKRYRITDPRQATAICLTGTQDLLNGTFQSELDATREGHIDI